jgi:hypothetical protein
VRTRMVPGKTKLNHNTLRGLAFVAGLLSFVLTSACSKSGNPSIGELFVTRPPTFGSLTDHSYTTLVPAFTLNGECDPNAYGLQYSFDNTNWTDYSGGCPSSGTFSLNLTIQPRKNIWARERTKNGVTSEAHAFVRIVLPPTAPDFSVAQTAAQDEDGQGMQAIMGINFDNQPGSNLANNIYWDIVEIVYGK